MATVLFLFLSLVSGAVEIGGVISAIRSGLPVLQIVGVGLAYQIGNLAPNPLRLGKWLTLTAAVGSAVCLGLASYTELGYGMTFLGYVLVAMSIQSLRALQKEKVNTTVKRLCRVAGFLLAPFMGLKVAALVGLLLVGTAAMTRWPYARSTLVRPTVRFLSAVMIVHQVHYFSYAYFMVVVLAGVVRNPWLIGLLFVLGWVTYTSVSHLLRGESYVRYLVLGHLFLTGVLFALAAQTRGPAAVVLWILTGFGGGTVFCIEKLNQLTGELAKGDLVFSENVGHILGVLLGMGVYVSSQQLSFPVYLAALAAAVTVVFVSIYASLRVPAARGVSG